jgi:uncharacterized protein DUF4126
VAVNASPEPLSNMTLSLGEDALTFGSAILMAFYPVVMLIVVVIFLIIAIWLLPKIFRAIRRLLLRARSIFGGGSQARPS